MRLPDGENLDEIGRAFRFIVGVILSVFACGIFISDDPIHEILALGIAMLLFKAAER